MTENKTFEENLEELQQIVDRLQQGDVPLEEAMNQFQKGVKLSQKLEKTLSEAENKLTKVMTADGQEQDFHLADKESSQE
ncbi:Exodeoxyribonuclease 7 small subunit [Bombilactobacillus mellis]|uniref:Exodeoxyribonuclease 7 small subunit n=1 Tax=Bombilactobacillus mellis TaxID=1218508 RepID=A0A0F4KR78_9LACO|nr:exodeoxyribonuclease VII small subunit [Bombilactobacillus mellis]MBI0107700.1 exodeoxyribonuclease VII small subunit [Lactobacillus sp. W8086]MBI0109166.1 exodeoxyribonuclease VII small subunit [Lactobacillus sp. W8085]MBI0112449.1 exodeoxyribonuclease VII small subunit [Lactobacillus sp. W8088]MBI0116098.1 exodeoxyribonuclease VII small subunit [Lactobacillus sp. W8087]MBI0119890.1 exodeoxyribonuclease VII small subunit [Lactobacillus sp. W8089]MBI0131855.1 exodeoxyribonuclease VII small